MIWVCAICHKLIHPDEDYHSWNTPFPDDEVGWAKFRRRHAPRWYCGGLFHAACCPHCECAPKPKHQAILDAVYRVYKLVS